MTLRISGGAWRGRALAAAPGSRPTQERVREALFSSWGARIAGAAFLDLFAGSGCVGFEALSRGAGSCAFVDSREQTVRVLTANARELQADVAIACLELPARLDCLPAGWPRRFDLIFADPPYDFEDYGALLAALRPRLAAGGEAAVEHSSRRSLAAGSVAIDRERRYGESTLTFLREGSREGLREGSREGLREGEEQ